MMTKFSSLGFTGLGFPCNSFDMLEPYDTYTELLDGLKYVRPGGGFVPNFPMFKKVDVNGKNEHPLFTYLKSECGPTSEQFEDGLFYDPLAVHDIRWNYEVFVVNQKGLPEFRYSPDHSMELIEADVKALLKRNEVEQIVPIVQSQEIVQIPPTEDLNGVPEEEAYYPDLPVA